MTDFFRDIIILWASFACSYWILSAFLSRKRHLAPRYLAAVLVLAPAGAYLAYSLAVTWFQTMLLARTLANALITIGLFSAAASLFEGSRLKKAFLLVTYAVTAVMADILTPFLFGLTGIRFGNYVEDFYVAQNVSITLQAVICLTVRALRQRRTPLLGSARAYAVQMVVPLISIVIMFAAAVRSGGQYLESDMIFFGGILLIVFAMYFVFEYMEGVYGKNQEYALDQQRYRMREDYYSEMEAHQKEIRTIKHDLKNQLMAIGAYLDSKERLEGAAEQVNALISRLSESSVKDFTAHPGLNALLSAKYSQAEAEGIICDFEVKVPDGIRFEERDLASVIGNVLDNAIEACSYCQGRRYIQLKLICYNHSLILRCENSTDGQVKDLRSRKGNVPDHGLGLDSVKKTVEKYNGDMQCAFKLHTFTIETTMFEPTKEDGI